MRFSDAYILVTRNITVFKKTFTVNDFKVFKSNSPFINCISKTNGIKIDNAEDLDVAMPMYNLLECSKNGKKTTGSLWNYHRDEPNSATDENEIMHSIINSKSFYL